MSTPLYNLLCEFQYGTPSVEKNPVGYLAKNLAHNKSSSKENNFNLSTYNSKSPTCDDKMR